MLFALYVQGAWGQTGGGRENHRGDYFFIWKPGPIPKNSNSVGLGGAGNSLRRLSNNKQQTDHFSNANLALLLVVFFPPKVCLYVLVYSAASLQLGIAIILLKLDFYYTNQMYTCLQRSKQNSSSLRISDINFFF